MRRALAAAACGAALLALAPRSAGAQALPRTEVEVLSGLRDSWRARDAEAYLRLWRFADDAAREAERHFLEARFAGDESLLDVASPLAQAGRPGRLTASASLFTVTEPRGRLTQMLYTLEFGPGGWAVTAREEIGQIDGLVHLSLDPQGYQAAGLAVRFEDFEMTWSRGSVFTSPSSIGPTVLVFVGQGTVRFRPRPETERDQLRQYAGRPELVESVRAALVRIHPADFHRVLTPGRLEPDPSAASRLGEAQRMYREQADQAFVLDTALPRSPWWLLPGLGDAMVAFQGARGTLTYALSRSDAEGITLFDRRRRRQIALYPVQGQDTSYDEDEGRTTDVLHHDLSLRIDPERYSIVGESRMRIRLLGSAPTVRLRLDESLRIDSIRSAEAGDHLFFRVRHQDTVMVSLGALAGRVGEIALTIRFSGAHRPAPVERELLQVPDPVFGTPSVEDEIPIEPVLVYSNRTAWYPQGSADDYATAVVRVDVPEGDLAVTGGTPSPPRTERGRTVVEYRQDLPGKYITLAVGRLLPVPSPAGTPLLRGYSVPRTRAQTAGILSDAAAILRFFEGLFGPAPYPALNVVVMEGRVPGGHSPPGMVVLSLRPPLLRASLRDDPASFWDVPGFFLAHELAHQWWGHGVAARNYHERWISEAMAHYAAALWIRKTLGEDAFRDVMGRMARWALRESDEGPLSLGHRLGHLQGDPQVYRAIVYDKGAWVLHMLKEMTGDAPFAAALAAVQREHRFGKAGAAQLRAALESASGLSLGPFFAQWVEGTAIPDLQVTRRTTAQGAGYETAVTVRGRNIAVPMPLEVAVVHAGGREAKRVSLPPEGGTFTIGTAGRPRRVEVNADGGLLARVKEPGDRR